MICELQRGMAVSWDGFKQKRYGCVMCTRKMETEGTVEVLASNARLIVPVERLTVEPSVGDPIKADVDAMYGRVVR